MMRRRCAALLAVLWAAACATEPEPPDIGPPGLRIVSGAHQSDTVQALLTEPLGVELRDSAGRPAVGVRVRFYGHYTTVPRSEVGPANSTSSAYDTITDARGRTSAFVRLGLVAGTTYVRATVLPLMNPLDSARATFAVTPGRPAQVVLPVPDSTAYAGQGYDLRASVGDRFANLRTEPVDYLALTPAVATVNATGRVSAHQLGRAAFRVTGSGFADTAWMTVPPTGTLAVWDVGGSGRPSGLVIVHLDGSGYRRLADPGHYPEWTATGDSLLYERSGRLWIIDTLGAVERVLLPTGPTAAETRVSASPDGAWLFFNDASGYCSALYRARQDGTEAAWIGPTACDSMVTWSSSSPDGAQAAVWAGSLRGIGILDVATGSTEIIVPGCLCLSTNYPARWSPDGAALAFVKDTVILLTTPAGATPIALTLPTHASYEPVEFDWSPDSQWLIARRRYGLDVIRVSDGLRLPLPWSERHREPAWRPEP